MTVPELKDYPFVCNCAERGVPEAEGCDTEHCPCYDCHTQAHAERMDALCCEA